ncbi:hypothetical protein [Bacillus sp. JCM 19041]|uniref:hypothetical protein n=1 Tax=Bacillus sp. JCM 19041 TaxID=1460637 RepID=UPI0006CF40F1
MLEVWSVYPSQKAMQLVALFERLDVPLQKKTYFRVTATQRKQRASIEEVELSLCYLNEKRVDFTEEWIGRSLVEIRAKKSVSATIHDLHIKALAVGYPPLIQLLGEYQQGEKQLMSDLHKAGPLKELLKRQLFLLAGFDKIVADLESHGIAGSVEELQERLMLQMGPTYDSKDYLSVVLPFAHADWDIQIKNEDDKVVGKKVGQRFHAMISTLMPSMGSLRMSIRLKEKRIFLVVYSDSPIPESFREAREKLQIRLHSKGFDLEVCEWIHDNQKQTEHYLQGGVDIKL